MLGAKPNVMRSAVQDPLPLALVFPSFSGFGHYLPLNLSSASSVALLGFGIATQSGDEILP